MSTWLEELTAVIEREFDVGQRFRIEDIYKFEDHFQRKFPVNQHIREKLRETLQHLRDARKIKFVDERGAYQRLV